MPNHCTNELIFRGADATEQRAIRDALCGADGKVDLNILVPMPANMWWGNVGLEHEKAFKRNALDWCRENWGTKWNAYGPHEIEATEDTIIFRFDTAWRPPYPWLAAVFNTLKRSFDHNWLSDGGGPAVHGVFRWSATEKLFDDLWTETALSPDDPLHRHLHRLRWGVEEFDETA